MGFELGGRPHGRSSIRCVTANADQTLTGLHLTGPTKGRAIPLRTYRSSPAASRLAEAILFRVFGGFALCFRAAAPASVGDSFLLAGWPDVRAPPPSVVQRARERAAVS